MSTGAILRGKYRLEASIGRGGMGEVFEATQLVTGQQVAVKVVSRAFVDELLMARLQREAEAARRVQSPFVPQLFDVDSTADGELFLVMERLHGETLSERLKKRGGHLTWDEVRRMGEDVLRGLIDAHAAGVIHRDLKPGNIFLENLPGLGERARILDFGVCKLDAHDGESLTSTGEAVGTISYMAPEQIRGASKVDERADVYSFATVIFEALSARLAHDASGQIAMIASKLERPARHLRDTARVPVPAGVDPLLARCLSRSPNDRPSSATDLLRAWRALGGQMIVPTPMPIVVRHELTYATETGLTAGAVSRMGPRGARAGLIVAACALLASSVVLVLALKSRSSTTAESAVSSSAAPPVDTPLAVAPSFSPAAPTEPASTTTAGATAPIPAAIQEPISMDDIDAGPPAKRTARPTTRKSSPPRSAGAKPSGPHIVAEPRY